MNATKYPTTVREAGDMDPRPLEGLRSFPKPPAGFTPNYFVNEFRKVPDPELVDYSAPDIERPGYKVLSSWTPEEGFRWWIDHNQDEAFTVPELQDLLTTLTGILEDAGAGPATVEGAQG